MHGQVAKSAHAATATRTYLHNDNDICMGSQLRLILIKAAKYYSKKAHTTALNQQPMNTLEPRLTDTPQQRTPTI